MDNKQAWHTISVLQSHNAGLRIRLSKYNNQVLNGDMSVMISIENAQTEIKIMEDIIATLAAQAEEFIKEITTK